MVSAFPRLRTHKRTRGDGAVVTYYFYDMRGMGGRDVPLGPDREEAVRKWERARNGEKIEPWVPPPRIKKPQPAKVEVKLAERKRGKRRKFEPETWCGVPTWARSMYLNAERRSVLARRAAFLSVVEFKEVVSRCDGRCELTGIQFVAGGRGPFSPSLDRIDSKLGYISGNVRVVCLIVNQALGEWGEGPLKTMAEAYLRNMRSASVPVEPTKVSGHSVV